MVFSLYANDDVIDSGFVFVDGKYIEAPYKVEAYNLAVYINGIQITKQMEVRTVQDYPDPGIPENIDKYASFDEALRLSNLVTKQWYLFTHYNRDEAFTRTEEYIRSLLFVKSLIKDPEGGWILENYAGERRNILLGIPGRSLEAALNPPTKDELIIKVNKLAQRYIDRLEKGDLFLIFPNEYEVSPPRRQAANLLPKMVRIMRSDILSDDQKVNELISFGILPRPNIKVCQKFVENFEASQQLEQRINNLRQQITDQYGSSVLKPPKRDLDLKAMSEKEKAAKERGNVLKYLQE